MSEWETIKSGQSSDGWETVPERISKSQFQQKPESTDLSLTGIGDWFFQEGGYDDFKTRLLSGIKTTPKGKREYLESVFGKGNVDLRPRYSREFSSPEASAQAGQPVPQIEGYEIQVRNSPDKPWRALNTEKFTPSDLAEWAAPAAEVGLNIGASLIPGGQSVAGQAAASAAGRGLRQAASSLVPGRDYESPAIEVPLDVAGHAAITAGTGAALKGAAAVFDAARPRNYVARQYLKAKETPIGVKGERLSERNPNVLMTPGQETQDPVLLALDEAGKKSIFASRKASTFYDNQITQSVESAKKAMSLLDDTGLDTVGRGELFKKMTNKAISSGYSAREANAVKNYAFANDAPNTPVQATNLSAELADISKSFAGLRTAIKKGETVLDDFFDEAGNVVNSVGLKKAIDNRRVFSNIARGKGTVYPSLSDQGMNREIGKRLVAAIEKDIEEAGASVGGEFGKKLTEANKQYAVDSQAIRNIKDTVFGKLIGTNKAPSPEDFVAALKKAKGTKMDALISMAKEHDPQFFSAAKGAVVEDMLGAARKAANTPSHQTMDFDPYKYVEAAYGWDRSSLSKIFKSSDERIAFMDTVSIMKRIRGNEAMGGGQPAIQPLKEGAMVASSGSAPFAASWFTKWIISPAVSRAIFDPTGKGQAALRTIAHTKPGTTAFANAMSRIAVLANEKPSDKEVFSDKKTDYTDQ